MSPVRDEFEPLRKALDAQLVEPSFCERMEARWFALRMNAQAFWLDMTRPIRRGRRP